MGSSNGIAQLELGRNQANTGIGTAFTSTNQQQVSAINYARSSRDPSSGNDIQGLNFVAYAKDGVAPLIWSEANSVKTSVRQGHPGHGPDDRAARRASTTARTTTGPSSAPQRVPRSSSTRPRRARGRRRPSRRSWASTPRRRRTRSTAPTRPPRATRRRPRGTPLQEPRRSLRGRPATALTGCQGPQIIFENEDASILANANSSTESPIASAWAAENGGTRSSPVRNSVFFYSWGKFSLQCEGIKEQVTYLDKSPRRS